MMEQHRMFYARISTKQRQRGVLAFMSTELWMSTLETRPGASRLSSRLFGDGLPLGSTIEVALRVRSRLDQGMRERVG
jgi:hypothetical protein